MTKFEVVNTQRFRSKSKENKCLTLQAKISKEKVYAYLWLQAAATRNNVSRLVLWLGLSLSPVLVTWITPGPNPRHTRLRLRLLSNTRKLATICCQNSTSCEVDWLRTVDFPRSYRDWTLRNRSPKTHKWSKASQVDLPSHFRCFTQARYHADGVCPSSGESQEVDARHHDFAAYDIRRMHAEVWASGRVA